MASAPHSGNWLHAPPIASIGLLSGEAIRLTVAQRLGLKSCSSYTCGVASQLMQEAYMDSRVSDNPRHNMESHEMRKNPGIQRADRSHSTKRQVTRWHDAHTAKGKALAWDVTIPDTYTASHLQMRLIEAGSAAKHAARMKTTKYQELIAIPSSARSPHHLLPDCQLVR